MKIEITNFNANLLNSFRRAGYIFQRQENAESSFVRPLARAGYPRFHIYASVTDSSLIISIHLDQKKETYGSGTRHHGEYEDEGVLKAEVERLKISLSS